MTIPVLCEEVLDYGFRNIAAMHTFTLLSSVPVPHLTSLRTDMHYAREACQHVGDPCSQSTDTPASAAAIVGSAARRNTRQSPRALYV